MNMKKKSGRNIWMRWRIQMSFWMRLDRGYGTIANIVDLSIQRLVLKVSNFKGHRYSTNNADCTSSL